jgi:Zn-dependent protease
MAEYYKLDSSKITLGEYWNITRSWKALIPWVAARLGAPLNFGTEFRQPETVKELEVPEAEFSPQARAKLQPLLDQCLQLGFHSPRFYCFESMRHDVRTSFISMLHRSGDFTLRLMHSLGTKVTPPKETVLAVLLSELNDGKFFFTSDQRPKFKSTPGILNNRLVGAAPLQLIESHQQKLAELGARNPPKRALSTAALDDIWDRYEKLSIDFQIGRGLYVRMQPEEVEGQQKVLEAAQAAAPGGGQYADVLVELNQLQNKKGGWGNAILILVVSVLLFVGAGSRQWSWQYVLMLVPILFVHEIGHYLAMRAFNYRNLRMFFIPFFGAAVSGRHYNVPGWKKVVVSMMGPVPGIVLGAIIGGAGLVLHQPWLIKVALVSLILNGINLLPVLPLDGGWVFHTLLFSRHHLLDAAFRVLAAFALMAGGSFSNDKILMYLGIPMLIGIPAAYRVARITRTMRERGVPPASPDDQTIPTETAVTIIDELKKALPKGYSNKMLAQQTLQIFENMNSRPPGWLASLGLFFVYFASLGMAGVFAMVLVVGQRTDLQALLASAAVQPKRPLICGTFASWRGPQATGVPEVSPITVVASFPRQSAAQGSFQALTNQLPADATLLAFGESVLLTLPAADSDGRKHWFGVLQGQTKEVFVDSTNYPAMLSLSCQVASLEQVKALQSELNEYLSNDSTRSLIPPWLPGDRRTAEQRAAHQLARKTCLKAQAARWQGHSDPRMTALQKKIAEARRQGDEAEVTVLNKQFADLSDKLAKERLKLAKERLNQLKSGQEGPVDPVMIDLRSALPGLTTVTNDSKTTLQAIAQRMGQLPLVDGHVAAGEDRFSARGGSVFSQGRTLHLNWVCFRCVSEGAPALVDWLCRQGCTDLKYDIRAGAGGSPEEDE